MIVHVDQLALADEECYTELCIIDLERYSESLENGKAIFTGRGTYVLLSIDSKSVLCRMVRRRDRVEKQYIRERERERVKTGALFYTTGSDRGKPQYKSLLDAPYMTRDLAEKLDELSNPHDHRPKRRTHRASTIAVSKIIETGAKRRPSVPTVKRPQVKMIKPVSSIAE